MKVFETGPNTIQIYPKLVLTIETSRSDSVLNTNLAFLFGLLKTEFRNVVLTDSQTSIIDWHFHRDGESIDEIEP